MSTSTAKPSQVKKQSQENAKKPSTTPTGPTAKDTTSKSKLLLALKDEVLRLRTELQEEREEREKISSWLAQTLKPRLKEQFDELRETSETHEQQIGAIKNFLRDNRGALSSGGADTVSRKDFEELEKQLAIEREARQQLSLWIKSQFGKNMEVLDARIAAQIGKSPSTPALPPGGAVIKPTVSVLPDSVPEWLRMIGYERYIDEFQRFKCTDLDKVTRLTDDHLVKMGIGLKRHRGDLLHEVSTLRSKLENKEPEPLGSAFPATPKRNSSVVESPAVDPFTESDIEDKIEEEYKERDRKRREEKAWEEQQRERIRKEIEAEERARIEAERARSEAERKKAERARALQEEKELRERELEEEREREKARVKAEKDRQREKERERIRKELEAEERARIEAERDEERKKADREEQARLRVLEQERKEIERKQKQLEKERADLEKQRKSLETKRAPPPEPEPVRDDDSSSEDLFASKPSKPEPKSTPKTAKKPTRKDFSDSEDDVELPPEKPATTSTAVAKRDNKPKDTAPASSSDGRSNEDYIADVRSDNDATNWVIFYYDKQSNSVKYGGSGSKGHAELLSHFEEDKVQYALLRVVDANSRIKFVYIQWIGPSANFMVKSRSGTCKAGVLKMIGQFHIEIIAESLDDISKKAILSKLQAAVNF